MALARFSLPWSSSFLPYYIKEPCLGIEDGRKGIFVEL